MFYFQQMFQTVLAGIDSGPIMATVLNIAQAILVLCALIGIFEAYSRGGDVRAMGAVAVKFMIIGLIIAGYPSVFRSVNGAVNQVAGLISPTDVWDRFRQEVGQWLEANVNAWWNLIPGGIAGLVSLLLQLAALIIYPIMYALFSLLYSMYGSVLYVCGPLVIAMYPSFGAGQLARTYLVNLVIFNAWGIIYAVFGVLLTAINANSVTAILANDSVGGAFLGSTQAMLIALGSLLLSIMIALIPFIARRIVSGDIGTTMFALAAATATLVHAASSVVLGQSAGHSAASHGGAKGGGGAGLGSSGGRGPEGGDPAAGFSNRPPPVPAQGSLAVGSSAVAGGSAAPRGVAGQLTATAQTRSGQEGGQGFMPAGTGPQPDAGYNSAAAQRHYPGPGRMGHFNAWHAIGYGIGTATGTMARWTSNGIRGVRGGHASED